MDTSKVLLRLLDFFFGLMVLFLVLGLGFYFYVIILDSDVPFQVINKNGEYGSSLEVILRVLHSIIHYVAFVMIVFFLRKGVHIMVCNQMFHPDVAKYFHRSGLLLVILSAAEVIINFSQDLLSGVLKLQLDPFDWKSGLFMVVIGLFLMLTGRVIKEGIDLKSENDLTI